MVVPTKLECTGPCGQIGTMGRNIPDNNLMDQEYRYHTNRIMCIMCYLPSGAGVNAAELGTTAVSVLG